ncbi:MAG: YbaB/EbfC family nucleoid-associated protein, partial [Blastocatellia bacterium]|nr:YbaB/EbfC family nucleoid-associated protein [Blastocatellia bacterium]
MKFPGGFDLNSMMKQAQQMQEEMGKQMKSTVVDASAGGGAVTVKMRGDFEVLELVISPDLVKDGDVEMIQDLTMAALGEARRKVEEKLKGQIGGMLPPDLNSGWVRLMPSVWFLGLYDVVGGKPQPALRCSRL